MGPRSFVRDEPVLRVGGVVGAGGGCFVRDEPDKEKSAGRLSARARPHEKPSDVAPHRFERWIVEGEISDTAWYGLLAQEWQRI